MRGARRSGFAGHGDRRDRPRAIFNSGLAPVRSSSSAFTPAAADFLLTLSPPAITTPGISDPPGNPEYARVASSFPRLLRGCVRSHPGSRESGPKPKRCQGAPDPVWGTSAAMRAANSAKYPKTRRLWHHADDLKITAARGSINAKVRARRDLASSVEAACGTDRDADDRQSYGWDPGARLARQGSGLVSSPRSRRSTARIQRDPPEDQRGLHCSNRFVKVNVG